MLNSPMDSVRTLSGLSRVGVILGLGALALAVVPTAEAATIRVVDCVGGPYLTIQAAVDDALDGDTIVVHECAPTSYEPFAVTKNRLHIVAADLETGLVGAVAQGVGVFPAGFVPPVVVDGGGQDAMTPCVSIVGTQSVTIEGFYLIDCAAAGVEVGAGALDTELTSNRIESAVGAGVTVAGATDTVITGNLIVFSGAAGVFIDTGSQGTVATDNLIGVNTGRGILNEGTGSRIVNNSLRSNGFEGLCENGSNAQIARNTALDNGTALVDGASVGILVNGGSDDAALTGNDAGLGSILDPLVRAECSDNNPPCDQTGGAETCSSGS